MKSWLAGLLLLCAGGFSCAATLDPMQVSASHEGDHVVLLAHFVVPVSRDLAWGVMVDFENMTRFLPYLKESKVLFRQGNSLRVQQKGVVPVAFFEMSYTSVRDIDLFPESEIHSTSIGGDTGLTRGITKLAQLDKQTEISYRADWWPTSRMVEGFGLESARDLLSRQFTAMRDEMVRRQPGNPPVLGMAQAIRPLACRNLTVRCG
ncbi:MAG: SRPBCC family protein [Formivibrio sp.]|nr:SRPBCC family protein [Formivibrio sp.]